MDIPMPDRTAPGHIGCVMNFDHEGQRLTVWNTGTIYRLTEFGCGGAELPLTHDPLFQSIAGELLRFGAEIGRLRRREMEAAERERKLREALAAVMAGIDDLESWELPPGVIRYGMGSLTPFGQALEAARALLKEDE